MPLLIILIVVPLLELYLLIQVGSAIGVLATLGIVILTAVLGTWMLRQQGIATFQRYQQNVQQGKLPAQEMLEGLALLFGGALLLTPGFFTDGIGFLCLFPLTRQGMIRWLLGRISFSGFTASTYTQQQTHHRRGKNGDTIEGEYTKVDEDDSRRNLP